MPPASKAASAASKFKANFNDLSTSPETDNQVIEQETVQRTNKKKKNKQLAIAPNQSPSPADRIQHGEIGREIPAPTARSEAITTIPRSFPTVRSQSPPSDNSDDVPTTEKVSDQHTSSNEDDNWLQDAIYGKNPPIGSLPSHNLTESPSVEPGFSTRSGVGTRSPPSSPPDRRSRPISHGSAIQSVSANPRVSSSPYSRVQNNYGSPPAPHMPQQHFYHAHDIDLGLPRVNAARFAEEPVFLKHTKIPGRLEEQSQGIILGFDGRISIIAIENGKTEEIGTLGGLPGLVTDAVLFSSEAVSEIDSSSLLIALVIHGPKEIDADTLDQSYNNVSQRGPIIRGTEYTTRVAVYSLSTQKHVFALLQTPPIAVQPSFRGAAPEPPRPIGNFKLYVSNKALLVASGTSGELYVFSCGASPHMEIRCMAKLWTTVQPQAQRRDSSHSRASDADVSPADLGRGPNTNERAIVDINGRWLAICPASSPSRPSLGAILDPHIPVHKGSGIETTTAPSRSPASCEVDSPDADSLLGKVARGVAQELVKGARWLGDQGYQTWQSYWRRDQISPGTLSQQPYSPPTYVGQHMQSPFPPTHADNTQVTKEPEVVSVYDLQFLDESSLKRSIEELKPIATFQPPRGCSYVSFAPHGLHLLTSGRKGDVQYVWDLMQIKHSRTFVGISDEDRNRSQPRVRQVARYERLSGSTIIDVVWDGVTGSRLAVLTKNKTIHLFDLPDSAFRWPPPRALTNPRSTTKSVDAPVNTHYDVPQTSGLFASALSYASKAQPIVANWRGRAPSMGGGLAGIGSTGIGLASATGARGGKVVAAGLSKSLGAASETVSSIRHAGEGRLHLKLAKEPVAGKICWHQRHLKSVLCVLDQDCLRQYYVRKNKPQDRKHRETNSVFDVKKAVNVRLPASFELHFDRSHAPTLTCDVANTGSDLTTGFWKPRSILRQVPKNLPHPLSFAEIETNAPFQPFHTDRRVALSVFADGIPLSTPVATSLNTDKRSKTTQGKIRWAFGDEIGVVKMQLNQTQLHGTENTAADSIIYRETTITGSTIGSNNTEQIVSTTRRSKKKKKDAAINGDDGIEAGLDEFEFENECEMLGVESDRV